MVELLVVVAIVAILSATLLPVFASAKESANQTQSVSNLKQVGTACRIYVDDYDGILPLAITFNSAARSWRLGTYTSVPSGWTSVGNRDVEPRKSEEASFVLNALRPYVKDTSLYTNRSVPTRDLKVAKSKRADLDPVPVNVSMNGQLHAFPEGGVAQPSRLPLFTQAYRENQLGFMLSYPQLCCSGIGNTCQFNPQGMPGEARLCSYTTGYGYVWFMQTSEENFTVYVQRKAMLTVAVDTSVHAIRHRAPLWPKYAENANTSPWSSDDPYPTLPAGTPYWMTDCKAPGQPKSNNAPFYAGYFRPDNEFAFSSLECDFGGG
ncbi:MAG: type II secretion system protein [Fimbriimonadaceae bacterium]|nr:type II secretion system protein [Fimbriimonadaceae bacterium]QYK57046.1 MAG: type II secretion system protein [Fimbriimonadaceae bacterium]